MLAFELRGGAAAVARLFGALPLVEFAPSFGDVTTTWTYPARTSHRPLSPDEQAKLGIDPGLVRLSVGIEDVEDLRDALAAALGAAGD
jgi:O-succinylhomoserine sulfhydrylase